MYTFTIAVNFSGFAFMGISGSGAATFDRNGVAFQYGYSSPKRRETTSMGALSASMDLCVQVTTKEKAEDLEGISTYLSTGFNAPLEIVVDKPVADHSGELMGLQFSHSVLGAGIDFHVAQTDTKTIKRIYWEDIVKWLKSLLP